LAIGGIQRYKLKSENLYLWDCRRKTPYQHLGGNKTISAVITSCMLLQRHQTNITFIMNCSHNLPWYKRENLYLWDWRRKTPYQHLGGNKTMSAVITSCMLLRRCQTISPSSWVVVTIYNPMTTTQMTSVRNSAQNFYTNISIQHEKDSMSLDILLLSL
jgi:hypothetical protein